MAQSNVPAPSKSSVSTAVGASFTTPLSDVRIGAERSWYNRELVRDWRLG
jgi:hypothetical protein